MASPAESHRHTGHRGRNPVAQRKPLPGGDIDWADGSGSSVDGTRATDADRADRAVGDPGRVGDHAIEYAPDVLGVLIFGRRLNPGVDQLARRVDESDGDLGAADIEGQGQHRGSVSVGVVGLTRVAGMLVAVRQLHEFGAALVEPDPEGPSPLRGPEVLGDRRVYLCQRRGGG